MPAAIRSIVIGILGLMFAVLVGSQLGQGSWMLPTVLGVSAIVFAIYALFLRAIRIEALILGFLIFGYIVGNRGFAQLTLTQTSPVYLGEFGMMVCLALLLSRVALKHERLIPRTPLSTAVLIFLIAGAVRLVADLFLNLSPATTLVIIRSSH